MKWLALAVAACGGSYIVSPARAGQHRIVTYGFRGDAACSRIVLDEQVTGVDGDRELAIVAKIIDGDRDTCGVGTTLDVHAGAVTADRPLDDATLQQIRQLHARLGATNGAFAFAAGALPWDGTALATEPGYLDLRRGDAQEMHAMSDTHQLTGLALRIRTKDHALACASVGGSTRAWIEVDYGDGAPHCPPR